MHQIIYKVPNGKLLKVFVEFEDDNADIKTIKDIKITGDFFMHPEEKITILENAMKGKKVDDELKKNLQLLLEKEEIELYGFAVEDLVGIIGDKIGVIFHK